MREIVLGIVGFIFFLIVVGVALSYGSIAEIEPVHEEMNTTDQIVP